MTPEPNRDALQRLIEWLIGGCVLALAALGLVNHVQSANLDEALELARHSRATIDAIERTARDLADAESALDGYLLTRQPARLAASLDGAEAAGRGIGRLAQRVDAGTEQQAALSRLEALGRQKIAEIGRVAALHPTHPDEALEIVRGDASPRLTADFRALATAMGDREQAILAQRLSAANTTRMRMQILSWLTELGIVIGFAGGYFVVRRELRARMAASDALRANRRDLAASEQRIAAIANTLPALIAYVDRTETYRFANVRYETFFGVDAGGIVGKTLRDLLGAQTYAATKGRVDAVLAGRPQTFERPDRLFGRENHVMVNFMPDRDAAGEVVGFYVMVLDITDRKKAEMAQQVNERRLRAITDNVPAIIAHLDRHHRYLHTNEGFRRLWGIDPNQLIGRTLREFRGEAVYAQLVEHLLGVLQGETRRFEIRDVIDGIEHHFQLSLVPDVDPHGEVQGYYSVSFDITDLRRNEQLVIESSARHRSIVEEQAELVSLARPDGELIYANRAYARHYGTTPAMLVGRNLFDFVAPADDAAVRADVAAVIASGTMRSCENRTLGADGNERWVAWTNTLQRDASGVSTLRSVGRDVTEQRRAEQALRASEKFLGRTGRLAGVGGYAVDLVQGTLFWSPEVRRIHEVAEDFEPTLETAIDFYAPQSRPLIQAAVQRAIDSGQSWDLELQLVTATGRPIWVRAVGDAEDEHGKTVRIVGAFQDITARKAAELAVEQKERLLRAVTDNLPVLVMYVDDRETVRFVNATGASWLQRRQTAALDRPLREVAGPVRYDTLRQSLQRALEGHAVETELLDEARGRRRHLQVVLRPDRQADGSVSGAFLMVTDVSTAKQIQLQLESLARIDALTGLPNRRQFDEKLDEALRRSQRGGQRLAVMFLDIDHFKSINDTLGHAGGDAVLREFGARLRAAVRETDVVARLAGDEFVVLLEGLAAQDDASVVAEKIVDAMRTDFAVDGAPLRVTTSLGIGIAGGRAKAPTASELMMCADKALYEAKREGRDGFRMSNLAELSFTD